MRELFYFCLVLSCLLVLVSNGYSAAISENEAVAIADLWLAMELNSGFAKIADTERMDRLSRFHDREVFYLISKDTLVNTAPEYQTILAYVITYKPAGFVVVTGDDRIKPIIVFDLNAKFRWDNPESNFLRYFLGKTMIHRWRNLSLSAHPHWYDLRSKTSKSLNEVTFESTKNQSYILLNTALWDQDWPYNDVVITNNGNIAGIRTGCTATAMAIKMRYHEWPPTGNFSHSYSDNEGNVRFTHSVNFANQTYTWTMMPTENITTLNQDVADLMYHCGVAVDMNYEVERSGAWPSAASMNTFFRYKGTEEETRPFNQELGILTCIFAEVPVICSSSIHTVVADGYRDSPYPYYHLNCGWGGNNNGWYDLFVNFPGDTTDTIMDRTYRFSVPQNYVYVRSDYWNIPEDGTLQRPFKTLLNGVIAISTNDAYLWIHKGSYYGANNTPITIDKAMTIKSYNGTVTIGSP